MTTALQNIREDQALGAAWRRCEAALPEGWALYLSQRKWDGYSARARRQGPAATFVYGYGPTPTAALEALAEKLEALR